MDKNELLKYLICEIDLVMHDKDYRFENEDGTWYSRESCKNLTNEEVFEELKSELRQLAKIEDDFADLEAKLAEKEKEIDTVKNLKADEMILKLAKQSNQKAIAELEKVLEWLNIPFDENGCLKNGEDLENYIDQQINELKGDK